MIYEVFFGNEATELQKFRWNRTLSVIAAVIAAVQVFCPWSSSKVGIRCFAGAQVLLQIFTLFLFRSIQAPNPGNLQQGGQPNAGNP